MNSSNGEKEISRNSIPYVIGIFLLISIPLWFINPFLTIIPQYVFALIFYFRLRVSENDEENIKDRKLVYALSILMVYQSIMLFFAFFIKNQIIWGVLFFNLFVSFVSYLLFKSFSSIRGRIKNFNPIRRFFFGPIFRSVDINNLFIFYIFSSLIYVSAFVLFVFNAE